MNQQVLDLGRGGRELIKLESLIDLAQTLGAQSDYDETLRLVAERASNLVPADAVLIMMINPRTRNTVKTLYPKKRHDDRVAAFVHAVISGWVIVNNAPLLSENLQGDDRFRKNLFKDTHLQSALCIPFKAGSITLGTLLLLRSEEAPSFSKDDLCLFEKLAAIVSPFLHSAQLVVEYFMPAIPEEALLNKFVALGLYGKSPRFVELLHSIEAASRCDVRVLLEGESGTGKELVARALHRLSARSENCFVAIDCGAIQPNLVESELFGHVKGAFTGASMSRRGLFEEANGGTLFMDEVNNLPLEMQAKLLRVLQDREIRPVGSNVTRKVNVRVITASSCSLQGLVAERKFREDLFYRLNVYPVSIPSLQERIEDISILAGRFLERFSSEQGKEIKGFDDDVIEWMKSRHWPGNVRELENFIERLVTLTPKEQPTVNRSVLAPELQKELGKQKEICGTTIGPRSLKDRLAVFEDQAIRNALEESRGNQSKAARILKVSEHSLRYRMAKLGIQR